MDTMWLRGRPGVPAALNIGGIASVTVDGRSFDTGPGNALMDAAVRELAGGGQEYDRDGALAARGTVHEPLLRRLLDEPYYALPAPKSTGRELFHLPYLRAALDECRVSDGADAPRTEDVLATLARLTARTVADALRAAGATEVLASGSGTRNPVLMAMLADELAGAAHLTTSDSLGLPSAAKEAYAFAVLGWLTVHGLASTDPRLTGARHPGVLGSLTPGRAGFPAPSAPGTVAPHRLDVVRPVTSVRESRSSRASRDSRTSRASRETPMGEDPYGC